MRNDRYNRSFPRQAYLPQLASIPENRQSLNHSFGVPVAQTHLIEQDFDLFITLAGLGDYPRCFRKVGENQPWCELKRHYIGRSTQDYIALSLLVYGFSQLFFQRLVLRVFRGHLKAFKCGPLGLIEFLSC